MIDTLPDPELTAAAGDPRFRVSPEKARKILEAPDRIERQGIREERHARAMARYSDAERRALAAEAGTGNREIDVVYEGFQDVDAYTTNASLDKDYHHLRRLWEARRPLPVKQYLVRTDGELVKVLAPAAVRAVAEGLWCIRCEQAQPAEAHIRREAFQRAAAAGIEVVGMTPRDNCAFCGGRLCVEGEDAGPSGSDITPEQQAMIHKLTHKAPNG